MRSVTDSPVRHPGPPHVALIVETTMSYGRRILLGVSQYLRERGPWSVYLETRSLYDPAPPWIRAWDGDGILCRVATPASAETIRRTGIPTVNLSASIPSVTAILGEPLVVNDQQAIGRLGAEHFLERGFTHFGYFGFPGYRWSDQRCEGFRQAVEADGFPCVEYFALEKPTHRYRARSWEKEMNEAAEWVRGLPKPVGLLASHDYRAVQLLDACRRAGVAVPEEAAVLGVDDEDVCCELAYPPLSSIVPDHRRMGFEAAALLDRLMRGEGPRATPLYVPPLRVVTRQSTDVTAIADPLVAKAVRFIRERACQGINVEDVLRHLLISRSALQLRFRKCLKQSIHDMVSSARMRRARELLGTTSLPLSMVSELAGFRHVEHFCAAFKRHTGATPGEYRTSCSPSSTP